jgi:GNAT superfamily N-acetyltransferase
LCSSTKKKTAPPPLWEKRFGDGRKKETVTNCNMAHNSAIAPIKLIQYQSNRNQRKESKKVRSLPRPAPSTRRRESKHPSTKTVRPECEFAVMSLFEWMAITHVSVQDAGLGAICRSNISKSEIRDVLRRVEEKTDTVLVATTLDMKLLGWLSYRVLGHRQQWVELALVCVSEFCAQEGIGRALILEFIELASQQYGVEALLLVDASGITGLYERFGFYRLLQDTDRLTRRLFSAELDAEIDRAKAESSNRAKWDPLESLTRAMRTGDLMIGGPLVSKPSFAIRYEKYASEYAREKEEHDRLEAEIEAEYAGGRTQF